ncbi:MAG: hypothetical protein H0X63_00495 [Flavobacteriales bacterium]|jgi:hypothetical protein|nr:hypothetical protein [Flavobacteriales bacterium]
MQQEILKIYHNEIGIAFQWRKKATNFNPKLIQIVFRDMGFHLTKEEIICFAKLVNQCKTSINCMDCPVQVNCRNILLETPASKVSLAVNATELDQVDDLMRGTLFQLEMDEYIREICRN